MNKKDLAKRSLISAFAQNKSFINIQDKLKIYPELESLIPPLTPEEYIQLKDNIKKEGCLEPLKYWMDGDTPILIDGHNRYKICSELEVEFKLSEMKFGNLKEVKDWMIDFQLGRRNLSSEQKHYLIGLRYNTEKQNVGTKSGQNVRTAEKIASEYNINEKSVRRAGDYATGLDKIGDESPRLKKDILSGKSKISKSDIELVGKDKIEAKNIEYSKKKKNSSKTESLDSLVKELNHYSRDLSQKYSQGKSIKIILEKIKAKISKIESEL